MRFPWPAFAVLCVCLLLPAQVTAQNEFLYVRGDYTDTNIYSIGINPTTGALTLIPGVTIPQPSPSGSSPIAADPLGRFLFAPNGAGPLGQLNIYTIDPLAGALTTTPGLNTPGNSLPGAAVMDPTGRFLYIASFLGRCEHNDEECGGIYAYRVDESGAATLIAGSPFDTPSQIAHLAIDPTGRFLYAANREMSAISAFVIQPLTGVLTPAAGSPFKVAGVWGFLNLAIDPSGRFLYASAVSAIYGFRIHSVSGALTALNGSPFAGGPSTPSLAMEPGGKFLYGTYTGGAISAWQLDAATGALTAVPLAMPQGPGYPQSILVDPSGQFLYISSQTPAVAGYRINTATGGLTPLDGSPFQVVPSKSVYMAATRRVPSHAAFVGQDAATRGNWQGVYGQDGKYIPANYYGTPPYSTFQFDSANERLYNYTRTDVRALQTVSDPNLRIESYFDSLAPMAFRVTATDGQMHRLALYFCDYDNAGRSVTVKALDTATGVVFDMRTLTNYSPGVYLVYYYTGAVTLLTIDNNPAASQITSTVSGFFWGGGAGSGQNLNLVINPLPSPVTGTVTLTATASPRIAKVRYYWLNWETLPGLIGESATPPFAVNWDTGPYQFRDNLIVAYGYDAQGNMTSAYANIAIASPPAQPVSQYWTKVTPATSPTARQGAAIAYHAARAETVLFGGNLTGAPETWIWDGANWSQRSPANAPAGAGVMTYDSARGVALFFGAGNQTWTWDGGNWTRLSPANSPPARGGAALAFDSARKQAVLFGGFMGGGPVVTLNDTWVWDGSNWTQKSPANNPPARWLHAMTYDTPRTQVVLFGGGGDPGFNDTWTWDGVNWTLKSPANSPPPTGGPAMAYDSAWRQTLLFTGFGNQTWSWDGVTWTERDQYSQPGARGLPSMAYDMARMRTVLFGGNDSSGKGLNDTWLSQSTPASVYASFVGIDATTGGNWQGRYGQEGKYLPAHYYGPPTYSTFQIVNANERLLNYTNVDTRALQVVGSSTQRIESYWDALGTMSFQVSTSPGDPRSIALYLCDYSYSGRSVTVSAIDTATGVALNTHGLPGYAVGVYLRYRYQGPVTFQISNNLPASGNTTATLSGFFWNWVDQAP